MKFFEVGPNLNLTQHAITIRPLVFLRSRRFKKLPADLQTAIMKAGKEAARPSVGRSNPAKTAPRSTPWRRPAS